MFKIFIFIFIKPRQVLNGIKLIVDKKYFQLKITIIDPSFY